MNKFKTYIRIIDREAVLWLAALFYLLFVNPYETQQFTLCPFHNIGIDFCPGCGMGRSISFFYHADFTSSIKTHPLGIAAFILISYRIFTLTSKSIIKIKQTKRGTTWQLFTN
ncbi:MAG: DUF2752 domain-containing protein [Ignavibacteriales bacterium]|nr:DUF2752 domain-containing protein [Ignavibacteriales bacterium]